MMRENDELAVPGRTVLSDDDLDGVVGGMMKSHTIVPPILSQPGGGADGDSNYSWWTLWNSMAHSLPPYVPD